MPLLCAYAASISDFSGLVETITGSIDGDRVSDYADPELRKARRSIANTEARIQSKMNSIISLAWVTRCYPGGLRNRKERALCDTGQSISKAEGFGTLSRRHQAA